MKKKMLCVLLCGVTLVAVGCKEDERVRELTEKDYKNIATIVYDKIQNEEPSKRKNLYTKEEAIRHASNEVIATVQKYVDISFADFHQRVIKHFTRIVKRKFKHK